MQLKKVELYNFSSYAGKASFDLSTQYGKNVVLIGGNNGAGKTSLFTAIKLALYGPLCFRYQGKNAQYSARIKELMNHDAFLDAKVKTYVEVELLLPFRQACSVYTLHREWDYSGQKVQEHYWVKNGNGYLSSHERDYFQNYLFTIIPPNLFELFFFDGEEIADLFTDASYSSYVKNAVLTLCGYDTFSLIQKFCDSYVGANPENEKSSQLAKELHQQEEALQTLQSKHETLEAALQDAEAQRAAALDEKVHLEAEFKKSGGVSQAEREQLNEQLRARDRVKNDASKKIRDFVEGLMPFAILHDLAQDVSTQLSREEKMAQYRASTQQLSVEMLRTALASAHIVSEEQIETLSQTLYQSISQTLCPEDNPDAFRVLHDLSQEQKMQVHSVLEQLKVFDPQDIIRTVEQKKEASSQYEQLSRQLRESLPTVDANTFLEKFSALTKQITSYENAASIAQTQLQKLDAEQQVLLKNIDLLRVQLQAEAKNKTAYIYTARVSSMMNALITDAVQEKFKQIETTTLKLFHDITHKDNFIDLLELDRDFNIQLYKEQVYTVAELYSLTENIGTDELQTRLGTAGMERLLKHFGLSNTRTLRRTLKHQLESDDFISQSEQSFSLYKRVELSQLSKGEKQVFLLSLYWAIIQSSGQQVPFIIDTPFARIDTEHRAQLTKLFFPSISEQVIILSTDEEVVGPYYEMLHDKLAHEYLLSNEETTGRTTVQVGYFPGVKNA